MKRAIGLIVMAAFLLCGVVAGAMFYRQYSDAKSSEDAFAQLQEQVKKPEVLTDTVPGETTDTVPEGTDSVPETTVFDKYRPLFEQNNDLVGWIRIEGTSIDYPVMQSPSNPDYYLKHSFEKKWSDYGVPYVDGACTVGVSNNLTIYGHNMKNGSMFHELVGYTSKAFYEEHPVIVFDTVDAPGKYQIIAAFRYNTNKETFFYNEYCHMDATEFAEYVENCKSRSLYDTGFSAEYGDELITLSTCEYTYTNGRFVVVAKKIVE